MNYVFQFIDHETGYRSDAFEGSYDTLRTIIEARTDDQKPHDADYILLVAIIEDGKTTIPKAPLITVGTFINPETKVA